jgi:hypothetical protein
MDGLWGQDPECGRNSPPMWNAKMTVPSGCLSGNMKIRPEYFMNRQGAMYFYNIFP